MTAKKKKPKVKTAKIVHVQESQVESKSTEASAASPLAIQDEPLTITEDVQADENAFDSRPENKSWFQWLRSLFS